MDQQIQDLLDRASEGRGGGKYLDQLTDEGREVLDAFETWLKEEDGKSDSTARAYKGYCAKAIVEVTADPEAELDTDVKSAINALKRFHDSGVLQAAAEDAVREPVGDDLT